MQKRDFLISGNTSPLSLIGSVCRPNVSSAKFEHTDGHDANEGKC